MTARFPGAHLFTHGDVNEVGMSVELLYGLVLMQGMCVICGNDPMETFNLIIPVKHNIRLPLLCHVIGIP
jgi:hypothetical protein